MNFVVMRYLVVGNSRCGFTNLKLMWHFFMVNVDIRYLYCLET